VEAKVKASMEEEQRLLKAFLTFELERKEKKRSLAIRLYENNVTHKKRLQKYSLSPNPLSQNGLKRLRMLKRNNGKGWF